MRASGREVSSPEKSDELHELGIAVLHLINKATGELISCLTFDLVRHVQSFRLVNRVIRSVNTF